MIKCSSETEILPNKSLVNLPLPWRSHQFNLLAEQLDQIHIHKTINTKGPKFVQTFTIENRRAPPTLPVSQEPSDVPGNLPIDCYTLDYLNTLTDTEKLILNPKPHVDLAKLVEKTQSLCG